MKLRFEVDQAHCMRVGIDAPKSIVTVNVDPATLRQAERDAIANRMIGIDVMQHCSLDADAIPKRVIAKAPTYEGLLEAVLKDPYKEGVDKRTHAQQFRESQRDHL